MKTSRTCMHLFAAFTFLITMLAVTSAYSADKLSAKVASEKASKGDILLVDIRTPKEWRETKIGASAVPISMHEAGFLEKLLAATRSDKSKPVALICATGGRSSWLQGELTRRGYTKVYDVAEGMLGSRAGQGWLKVGLPTKLYSP
jgi:rhodanese-related sulfurtransferase